MGEVHVIGLIITLVILAIVAVIALGLAAYVFWKTDWKPITYADDFTTVVTAKPTLTVSATGTLVEITIPSFTFDGATANGKTSGILTSTTIFPVPDTADDKITIGVGYIQPASGNWYQVPIVITKDGHLQILNSPTNTGANAAWPTGTVTFGPSLISTAGKSSTTVSYNVPFAIRF